MFSAIRSRYQVNLVLGLLLALVIILLKIVLSPVALSLPQAVASSVGILIVALAAAFFLDLDFIYYSLVTNPTSAFAQGVQDLLSHKNWVGLITYLNTHEDEIAEPLLRSSLFQIVLVILSGYLVLSKTSLPGSTFVLGILLQSLYLGFFKARQRWFWELRQELPPLAMYSYFAIVTALLVYFTANI